MKKSEDARYAAYVARQEAREAVPVGKEQWLRKMKTISDWRRRVRAKSRELAARGKFYEETDEMQVLPAGQGRKKC